MNRTVRRTFDRAAGQLIATFHQAGPFPDQEVTPPPLADAVRQCLDVGQRLDEADETVPLDELDELGRHGLECLADLGFWAYQLHCDDARADIEDVALAMAMWLAKHGGQITVLEPVVNALARQANTTQDTTALTKLFQATCLVMAHVPSEIGKTADAATLQHWLTLNFNCAIIATRTQDAGRMQAAYDLLESHLPAHCARFYQEGVRESQKDVYSDLVRDILQKRLAAWTITHEAGIIRR